MSYELRFIDKSYKEWQKLGATVKEQFKKKLKKRLISPKVESSRISGIDNCYKIKLRQAGFRLVYQVKDKQLIVLVLAVGKRERNAVYKSVMKRI
ncbi:RelE toxin [Marinicella pacifica]|uniref:RelE toxin n=1 Tax=Marinicella pacifica TaxID=1171543 RepID=A0A917CBH1_9GAMM|nr:type II toxin-antitoxin system RelE/ParE family toxin [Marinicella pacifica]GGF83242.1 RelE toxin [Marinicella pacifica]